MLVTLWLLTCYFVE